MLRAKSAEAAKQQTYACCGAPYDPQTQGQFKPACTDTWLCSACFTVAIDERTRREDAARVP